MLHMIRGTLVLLISASLLTSSAVPSLAAERIELTNETVSEPTSIQDESFSGLSFEGDGASISINLDPTDEKLITIANSTFTNNSSTSTDGDSGAIAIKNGKVNISNSAFTGNTADWGGALYIRVGKTNGSEVFISDSTFENNSAKAIGAVGNFASRESLSTAGMTLSNVTFKNNRTTAADDGGAAVFLGAESGTLIEKSLFDSNTSYLSAGGAIATRSALQATNKDALLDIKDTSFINNHADTTGGAIDNYFYNSINAEGSVYIADSSFEGNTATKGGAIYNHGELDKNNHQAILTAQNSTFNNNSASLSGGAIYNAGELTVGGTFDGNKAVHGGAIYNNNTLSISDDSSFTNNFANVEGAAIANYGNKLNIGDRVVFKDNASFLDGYSYAGASEMGALYTEGTASRTNEVTIGAQVRFEGNKSYGGAGLYIYGGNNVTVGDDAQFIANKAQASLTDETATSGGGAISLVSGSTPNGVPSLNIGDNALFEANTAAYAGAINVNSQNTRLTIGENAQFNQNKAVSSLGGAIYNKGTSEFGKNASFNANTALAGGAIFNDNILTIKENTTFNENAASDNGGALYNRATATLTGVSFNGNTANNKGGAIYNSNILNLAGNNTFSGNTAATVANDIHNTGTLNITNGITTLEGGITGTGSVHVLSGATLDIALSELEGNAISFANGSTLGVTLASDNMGVIKADTITIGENDTDQAKLLVTLSRDFLTDTTGVTKQLTNGTAVTNGSFALAEVTNALYNVSFDSVANAVTAVRKSQEEQNTEVIKAGGNTNNTAVINAFTSTTDLGSDAANQVSQIINTLAQTDVKAAVDATTALAPEQASAQQVVHSSAARQLFGAVTARLNDASMQGPRTYALANSDAYYADGTNYSVWVQGLLNKSHKEETSASALTGRSTGLAGGVDTKLGDEGMLGLGYAYLHTNVDSLNRHDRILGDNFFLYGQYRPSDFFVQAAFNYGDSKYEESKYIPGTTVRADYHIKTYAANLTAGYDLTEWISPLLGVRYMNLQQEGYKDSSDQSASQNDFLTALLGARLQTETRAGHFTLHPSINVAIAYDLLSDSASSNVLLPNGTGYDISGERLHRLSFEAGASMSALFSENIEVLLSYDGSFRQDYNSHTGSLKLRYMF